jgi:hypothetical protein
MAPEYQAAAPQPSTIRLKLPLVANTIGFPFLQHLDVLAQHQVRDHRATWVLSRLGTRAASEAC